MQYLKHVYHIREMLLDKFLNKDFVNNDSGSLSGTRTVEITGASFVATENSIFGTPNTEYIQHELDWYLSKSLNVNDIPDKVPQIWKAVSTDDGRINSNYGYLMFDEKNGKQYDNALNALIANPMTRRATMIYTRPTMHTDWCSDGMSDFVCTNAVQVFIRRNALELVVQMRSNDAVFGYLNDYAWHKYIQDRIIKEYNERTGGTVRAGSIHWQVASLHVYERHFYLLEHFAKTGKTSITKKDFNERYKKQ